MKYLDQLAGKGLSASIIAELIILNLAWMFVLAVPMSVLIATLMTFGDLASTNQVTAMRSSGMSLYKMIAPVLISSIVICILLIIFNNDVLPDANLRTKVLQTDISRKKPTLTLVPGMFVQLVQGRSILVKKTFEHSNDLEEITIIDYSKPLMATTITAHKGSIAYSKDYLKLIMDLYDGEIHQMNQILKNQYRIIRFKKHRIIMEAEGFNFQRSRETDVARGDREMDIQTMQLIVDSVRRMQIESEKIIESKTGKKFAEILNVKAPIEPSEIYTASLPEISNKKISLNEIRMHLYNINHYEREARKYLVEIHKKFSIPFACIVFVFIGAPLGIMSRRGTFGTGATLSVGFFFIYWACLIAGEKLSDRLYIQPWLGMWSANIILGILGGYLTYRVAKENLAINWTALEKFIPKKWRSESNLIKQNQ